MSNFIKTGNQVGKGIATLNMAMAVCIAMSLSSCGSFLLLRKRKHSEIAEGVVTQSECTSLPGKDGKVLYACEIEYEYTVGDKKYTKNTNMEKYKRYRDGDKVKIFYDPSNPDDNEVDGINQNMLGFGLIGGGFFIVMIATVGYLIATKIKGGGTALTAMTALSAVRR
tara:strand:+ start:357 stop:860 length:504 start_codon:yes stop_codon:yes gene_type:complete